MHEIPHSSKFFLNEIKGVIDGYGKCERSEEREQILSGQIDDTISALISILGNYYVGTYKEAYEARKKEAVPLVM